MTPQDNHDHSLMIHADWLDDQGKWKEATWLRDSLQKSRRRWEYQWRYVGGGVGGGVGGVGGVGVGGGVSGVGGVGVGGVGVIEENEP